MVGCGSKKKTFTQKKGFLFSSYWIVVSLLIRMYEWTNILQNIHSIERSNHSYFVLLIKIQLRVKLIKCQWKYPNSSFMKIILQRISAVNKIVLLLVALIGYWQPSVSFGFVFVQQQPTTPHLQQQQQQPKEHSSFLTRTSCRSSSHSHCFNFFASVLDSTSRLYFV